MKKLRDFLNRDIKEFNVKLLVLSGVLFIALMGFISYKLTNNSYALFTDTVTGTKTLTFNYTEDVYRYGEELAYLYSPLKSGTYNGYCGVKTRTAFALSKSAITSASASAKSLPMPGVCAPCPANMHIFDIY